MHSRYHAFPALVAAVLLLLAPAAMARPNFIFVFADDLGWGDLSCYGNDRVKTPNLDRLAEQGTLFTQFYVSGSVCSPSRTAIMTSHYPARHGVHGHYATHEMNERRDMTNWVDPAAHTVTRLLGRAGYATAHFGKWHLGSGVGAPTPGAYGIDNHRTVNTNGPGWDDMNTPYFRPKSSRLFVDEAIRFIEEHRGEPFYINVWSLVPHATLNPTDEQLAPYLRYGPRNVRHVGAAPIFFAAVTGLDTEVGRLMAKLEELGLADNTVVIFSSDNGPEDIHIGNANHSAMGSPGPFRGRKRSLYEGGVRVPFIVRWPGRVPAGRIDDESVVAGVDFLPTVCKLAGVELPADLNPDGEDRSAALLGKPGPRTRPLMWEWRFRVHGYVYNRSPILSIRDGNWKLLMNPDRSRVELYDIPNDPMEVNNLAEKHAGVVRRMSQAVLAWRKTLPQGMMDPDAGKNDYPFPKRN